MRNIREILRLVWSCKQSRQAAADVCATSKTTVTNIINRAIEAGLSWPLPPNLDDNQLEEMLFTGQKGKTASRDEPDWRALLEDYSSNKNVTMMLLWQEYKETNPDGYQYSRFSELFRKWEKTLDLPMRQEHRYGEKMFVDYCGQSLPIINPSTGEVRDGQVFVAVMGASNYTYCEVTMTQSLPDWIDANARAIDFLGAVPHCIVPDNLKSAVTKSCRYEPKINLSYLKFAEHYDTAIVPARKRKPKDKAKVEVGVQIVQRFILASLRKQTFFSLAEANAAIRLRLEQLNNRPFRKLPGCRRSRFEELDLPAMKLLPEQPYHFTQWKIAKVNIDYHVDVEGHFYSVPYRLARKEVDVFYSSSTVEITYKHVRVAMHQRSMLKGKHSTIPEHMPPAHKKYAGMNPQYFISWAGQSGPSTTAVIESILARRAFPEHGFRTCLGILNLGKKFGPDRLEAACDRALLINGRSYTSIKAILENELDKRPLHKQSELPTVTHDNIRGNNYFE